MVDNKFAPYAIFALRALTGALFLYHGLVKVFVFTPAGTAGYFEMIGLPAFLAYLTIIAEVGGGIALIVGFAPRLVSAALVPVLLGAAIFGHGGNGFGWSNEGGGLEYPLMWAGVQAFLALAGEGAFTLYTPLKKAAA